MIFTHSTTRAFLLVSTDNCLFEKEKIGQMASLVSYDTDNSVPEDEVVTLEDNWDYPKSPKVPRIEDPEYEDEDASTISFDIHSSESDSADAKEPTPTLGTFNGEGFQPDLGERELPNSAEIAGPSEIDVPSQCERRTPSADEPDSDHYHHHVKRKNPYALTRDDLSSGMRVFLTAVKTFFTQKVNLQRQKAPLAPTTYRKAEERMLCKCFCICLCFVPRV